MAPKAERTPQVAQSWTRDHLSEGVERGGDVGRDDHVVKRADSPKGK